MTNKTLTEQDFIDAAGKLDCEVAVIKSICAVEAPKGGFLPDGRPTLLFERHVFSKRTGGKYDASHPDISNKKPGGYIGGAAEHNRMDQAACLNKDAALMSASWGKFQIMGFNYDQCGFATIQSFVNAMYKDERSQLDAFVEFMLNNNMIDSLRSQ